MGVAVLSGEKFLGVDFGSAPGAGYVIGTTPVTPLLFVDDRAHDNRLIGVKYYHHPAGDPGGTDRPPDEYVRMTMLTSNGRWRQKVWSDAGHSVVVLLHKPGDFIAWESGLWHSWYPEADSTMLTVSYKRESAKPTAVPDGGG